jgi:hypothetical protein
MINRLVRAVAFGAIALTTLTVGSAVPVSAVPVPVPVPQPDVKIEIDKTSGVVGDKVTVTYTLSNLNKVTDFSHQFPSGMVSAAQVLAQTTCPVAVFPTSATASAGAKVRGLFNSVPDTPCKVVVGVTASKPGPFDLAGGFTSTTLGTRVVGDAAGDYTFTAADDTFLAHDQTKPTVTLSVDKTTDPADGHVTSALLGESQVLTYTILGRPYGTENTMSFEHTLPTGVDLDTDADGNTIVVDTCHVAGTPGPRDILVFPAFPGIPASGGTPGKGSASTAFSGVVMLSDGYLAGTDTAEAPSCEIKVLVKPSTAGPKNFGATGLAGFIINSTGEPPTSSLVNGVVATNVYIADPQVPTVTLSLDKSRITLGNDVILTYKATGMPYGTKQLDFSFADNSLSDMAQTYFSAQSIVSNTCGGNAQAFGVTGATLSAVTTAVAPSCELKVRWRALGAGHFDFGSNMILLNIANGIDPVVSLDVDPKLTMSVDNRKVVKGDNVTVTYSVDGGNSIGDNSWSWNQNLPAGFDNATYVSDSCRLVTTPARPTGGRRIVLSSDIAPAATAVGATASVTGMTGELTWVDAAEQTQHTCTLVARLHTAIPGHFDLGSDITTTDVTNLIAATDIFIADPTSPTMTLSTNTTNVGLGDDVDVTFSLTGVPYGTPHTSLNFWLEHPLLNRGLATSTLVSNTCGGTFAPPGIDAASLDGTESATAVTCKTVMRLRMLAAAVFDVANAFSDDGDILSTYAPLLVTVRPTLTVTTNATSVKVGDPVKLTYNVNAGVWSNPSATNLPAESALTKYSYAQALPGGLANPRVAVPSDAGCGNEFTNTATSVSATNNFATWSQFAAPHCTLVITATATKAGKFDALAGVSVVGLTKTVVPSTIYVADPTKPTVTMTASGTNFTTGDSLTLTYVVTGVPFGSAHSPMSITHALPTGVGTVTTGSNTCGGTLSGSGTTLTLTGAGLPGNETSTNTSCTFSATVKSAKAGSFDLGTGLTTTATNGLQKTSIVVADPAGFVAVAPARALDTRSGAVVAAGSTTEVQITGANGVPADATDVVLNVAVDGPTAGGYLTVYPCGTPRPTTSNVNFEAGETRSNGVTVKLGANGKVCIFSSAGANLVVDVNGAVVPHQGDGFSAFAPVRALDTRSRAARPAAGEVLRLTVRGRDGVPADASAVVLNVTSTDAQAAGFLTVFPCGSTMPLASSLNFASGRDIANSVVAKIGSTGEVCIYTSAATHVVVDVNGAFSKTSPNRSWSPDLLRLLDTRSSVKAAAGSVTELAVAGRSGVPANATAVVLNVTAVDPAAAGYMTMFPCGTSRPEVSNLNFGAHQTVPNAVTVAVGTGGNICVYTTQTSHLIVDLNGSYAPR